MPSQLWKFFPSKAVRATVNPTRRLIGPEISKLKDCSSFFPNMMKSIRDPSFSRMKFLIDEIFAMPWKSRQKPFFSLL